MPGIPGPALNPVNAGDAFAGRISSEFQDIWSKAVLQDTFASKVMDIDMSFSEKLTKVKSFSYFEDALPARRWAEGEARSIRSFRARNFQVSAARYEDAVEWERTTKLWSQVNFDQQIMAAANSFAALPDRWVSQMIGGIVDLDLLEVVPNAADGASIYNANNGDGNPRYNVNAGGATGNIYAQSGITAAAIRADFFGALGSGFARMQRPSGQPLFTDAEIANATYLVVGRSEMLALFAEAFGAQTVLATDGAGAGGGVTNTIMAGGYKVEPIPWNRVPAGTTDLYVFITNTGLPQPKPFFSITDEALESHQATVANGSDRALFADVEGVYWRGIYTVGVGEVYSTIVIR